MEAIELYRVFVSCMAAYLRGDKQDITLSAADWGKLYALAARQSLTGALFETVGHCPMPDAVHDRLRRDAFVTLANYENQQQILAELRSVFAGADTSLLLFKGAVTRRYYVTPAMRTMGDIDAAVPLSSRAVADAALLAAGFAKEKEQPEVWVYRKNGVLLELHTVLRRFNTFTQDKEPYEELWTDARLVRDTTYHLSDDAEIAFTIAHMASHFCDGGCGLRQLMDVAVLLMRFDDTSLWEHVLLLLEKDGTDRFARHMLWLCEKWFGLTAPTGLAVPLDSATEDVLLCRFLNDGVFGADERYLLSRMRQERRMHQHSGKGTMLRHWVFPSPAYLRRRYAYADKPLLLPVAYVHRLVDGVGKNRRVHEKRLQFAKKQESTLEDEVLFFEAIGL